MRFTPFAVRAVTSRPARHIITPVWAFLWSKLLYENLDD
jgi:hypothetical protein